MKRLKLLQEPIKEQNKASSIEKQKPLILKKEEILPETEKIIKEAESSVTVQKPTKGRQQKKFMPAPMVLTLIQ